MAAEPVVYRAGRASSGSAAAADPVTTEVIRHGLNSGAEAIKRTLVRTSMSPIIYEVLDFAAVLYDRMLNERAKAQTLYKEVVEHDTDPDRIKVAEKRLTELTGNKK